jgi:Skp family chaperone for outer membrane proteins
MPTIAGPTALPIALTLVATPFSVPNVPRFAVVLVKRIVQQGKEKTTQASLESMRRNTVAPRKVAGTSTVNGVTKYRAGKTIDVALKQLRTP